MTTFQSGSDLDIPGLGLVGTSRSDSQKLEANPIRQSSSFTQALGAAFRNELTGLTYDFLSGPGSRYDPSFVLTKDVLTQAREGVADEFVPMFADAGSIDDVQAIREVALERTRRMTVLANAGTTSRVAASILASVADPINLTAGVLTGSAGLGVGLTRAARITRAASAGFITNTALESYRSTLDPTVTGENIVVSGLSGAGLGAGIGGTLTRSAGVRALAGGVGAAAPVAAFQSDGDALESAIGIGTAFLAGGVAGTLTPRVREEASRVIRTQVKTMVREELGNAGTLTPEGERYFADTTPAAFETRQQAAVESVSNGVMDEAKRFDEIASIARANTEVPPTTAVGAATAADTARTAASPFGDTYDQTIPLPRNGFFTPQQATDGRSTGAHFGTMEAMAGRSSVPSIRRIANMVFDDPVPRSDGNVFEGADKWTPARTGEYANPFLRVANQAFSETGNTLGIDDAQLSRMWYRSVVSDANNIPASMLSLQDATRTAMRDVLEFEKAHQVPGAADVPANEFYLPHKGRRDLIDSLVLQYGEQPIIDHVAKAFKARRPQAPDRVANAVATAWVRKIGTHTRNDLVRPDAFDTVIRLLEEANTDPALVAEARIVLEDHVSRSADRGLLAQLRQTADPEQRAAIKAKIGQVITEKEAITKRASLAKQLQKATDAEKKQTLQKQIDRIDAIFTAADEQAKLEALADVAEIVRPNVKGADDAGNPSNYKHRLDLDELVESVMPDGRSISLLDMLETDPRVLIPHRIRRAAGNAAFAQILKWSQNPISPARPVTSLADLLESLRKDARDAGLPEGAEEGNIRRLEVGLKHVIGIPIDDIGNPTTQRAARMARIAGELTGAKFLSGAATGLANVTETIGAVAAVQLRTTFEMVPALKELRSMALDGKLTNADLALAESFTGAGLDSLTYVAPHRPSGPALNTFDRALTWVEPKSAKFNELAMRASLMTLGNEVSQKIIAGGLVHQWGKWIQSGKAPGKKWLKGTNLDGKPYLVDRIIAQGQKYGTLGEPGTIAGKKGFDLNWHEWDDVEAAAALRSAVNLEYGRLFLQPSKINAYAWSTTWWGKLALQLKRYPMAAFRSKLVYGFATGDVRHWAALGLGTAATVPIYIIRTYAESLGQDDPQKYREERLSMGAMARATVGRAAWASMLPSMTDSAASLAGFEPPFAISSTTKRKAQDIDFLNIPALGAVRDVGAAIPEVVQPMIDSEYSFSMQSLKKLERALMPNAIRQLHIIDAAGRMLGLPETSKE
jgi:hypothetical protein